MISALGVSFVFLGWMAQKLSVWILLPFLASALLLSPYVVYSLWCEFQLFAGNNVFDVWTEKSKVFVEQSLNILAVAHGFFVS